MGERKDGKRKDASPQPNPRGATGRARLPVVPIRGRRVVRLQPLRDCVPFVRAPNSCHPARGRGPPRPPPRQNPGPAIPSLSLAKPQRPRPNTTDWMPFSVSESPPTLPPESTCVPAADADAPGNL